MQWQYCGFSMLDDNALSAHKDVAEPILDDADSYKKHKKENSYLFSFVLFAVTKSNVFLWGSNLPKNGTIFAHYTIQDNRGLNWERLYY